MTYKWYEVIYSVRLNNYPKCDAFLFDRVGEIQSKITGALYIGHSDLQRYEVTRITQRMMLIYQIQQVIQGKITGPEKIGHCDLQKIRVH